MTYEGPGCQAGPSQKSTRADRRKLRRRELRTWRGARRGGLARSEERRPGEERTRPQRGANGQIWATAHSGGPARRRAGRRASAAGGEARAWGQPLSRFLAWYSRRSWSKPARATVGDLLRSRAMLTSSQMSWG